MVHILFDGAEVKLENFVQSGGGGGNFFEGLPAKYQRGYGYFAGMPHQRGHGVGNIFRSLWRFLKPMASAMAPIAKEAGRAIGQEGIATGARVLNELVQGREAKDAIASEGQEGIKRLLDRASARMQRGSGGKKRGASSRIMIKPGDIIAAHSAIKRKGPAIKKGGARGKRQRVDSLGYY